MKNLIRISPLLALLVALIPPAAQAQLVTTQTTFSVAVPMTGAGTGGNTAVSLTSCTGTVLPSVAQVGSYIWVDWEAMQIATLVSGTIGGSGTCTVQTKRAQLGTRQGPHATTAVVYITNQATGTGDSSRPFSGGALIGLDPQGSCVATANFSLPVISWLSGRVWTCPTTGPLANNWAVVYDPSAIFSITDGLLWVPATEACSIQTTGTLAAGGYGGSTANTSFGPVITGALGAGNVPVMQIATTNAAGAATHTYTCHVSIATRTRGATTGPGAGAAISDVTFLYGVQQNGLGTQVAVLASGTLNGTTVFGKVLAPTAGAAETASTVAPARADAGTMVLTPAVASFNTGTTTVGAFFSEKFAPATPIVMNADLTDFVFSVTLLCTTTVATTTNTPGFYVHIIGVPL